MTFQEPRGIIISETRKKGDRAIVPYYKLARSDNQFVQNGRDMDKAVRECMKQLNEPCFRSTKSRDGDRTKAIAKWGKKYDLSQFAIHHRFDGLVGLVPRDLHVAIHHYGYFWRLAHETA